MDTKHPTYKKIDNTFNRVMDEISKFEKVFQPGGKLEQAILEIDGDPSYLKDLATALEETYEVLQEAHYGTLGHVVDEQLSKKKKITPSTPVDMVAEGVLDGADEDGFMARSQLYFLARDAIKLHGIVKDQDDLAPWVSSKIAQASKDMDSVRRYTEYNAMKDAVQSMPEEAPSVNEGTMHGGLMKYDGQPEEEYAGAVASYKKFMSQPRSPGEATNLMVQDFIFDDKLLDRLGDAEDNEEVEDVRYIVQDRIEDFFGDAPFGVDIYEAKEDCDCNCGKAPCEKCGKTHHDVNPQPSIQTEGMEFNEKRDGELKVVAKDMFKNALANAKKKVK